MLTRVMKLNRIPDASFTLSKRPRAFPSGVWGQVTCGKGPRVWTRDGRVLMDWICGLGALAVGHDHPHVMAAVSKQLLKGTLFSLPSVLEEEVADRLCEVIPCADQVRVVKTGSEACSAAVRIARMATGRDVILTTETSYHGWHDGFVAVKPKHPGVPDQFEEVIFSVPYNELGRLTEILRDNPVAAVMLEPVQGEPPKPGYLDGLVKAAHEYGALVIFDEMLCGGRMNLGGAQKYYGVMPDLATFGKALGGGLPFAFVCGRSDLMKHAWPVSGTFSGDALALAAAEAMLDIYRDEPVITSLWRNGEIVQQALLQVAERYDLTLVIHGHAPRFWLDFSPTVDKRLALSVFSQQAAKRNQLVHPSVIFASAAMTSQEATSGASALADAMAVVCEGIKEGTLAELLVGDPYEDSVR